MVKGSLPCLYIKSNWVNDNCRNMVEEGLIQLKIVFTFMDTTSHSTKTSLKSREVKRDLVTVEWYMDKNNYSCLGVLVCYYAELYKRCAMEQGIVFSVTLLLACMSTVLSLGLLSSNSKELPLCLNSVNNFRDPQLKVSQVKLFTFTTKETQLSK